MTTLNETSWAVYVRRTATHARYVSFDQDGAAVREQLPEVACVPVTFTAGPTGTPAAGEAERLNRLEDEWCKALDRAKAPCRLLARVTEPGVRRWFFAAASRDVLAGLPGVEWLGWEDARGWIAPGPGDQVTALR